MLDIIRCEFEYNKNLIMWCLALIAIVCLYELLISEERIGYVLISRLPLSLKKIAWARLLMILGSCVGLGLTYYLIHLGIHLTSPKDPAKLK